MMQFRIIRQPRLTDRTGSYGEVVLTLHPGATPMTAELIVNETERETAERLGITRHRARLLRAEAYKAIERDAIATVADGAGI